MEGGGKTKGERKRECDIVRDRERETVIPPSHPPILTGKNVTALKQR